MNEMELKTPLYQKHVDAGAKIVPFAGYSMPVQYGTGVITEHMAVREKAGLFDVSHMGEVIISGDGALDFLQKILTNNMEGMKDGDCRYSPMCNENGGVVDDLLVYRLGENNYMMVVNASNKDKDVKWMQERLTAGAALKDDSENVGELALQGPKALEILSKLTDASKLPEKYYTFVDGLDVAGVKCLVSRTGYTGEDGFELYCSNEGVVKLWDALLEAGKEEGLIPAGLGARDTLRLEAGMPLYGHEMTDDITPREAGLGFFVKMDKGDFIGKKAMEDMGDVKRRRTGLKMTGRGIARDGCEVYVGDKKIGYVTSGTQLPCAGYAGAMALLDVDNRAEGTEVEVDVRGRRVPAVVVKMPFYKRG